MPTISPERASFEKPLDLLDEPLVRPPAPARLKLAPQRNDDIVRHALERLPFLGSALRARRDADSKRSCRTMPW